MPVVGPPGVGGFNDPAQAESEAVGFAWFGFGASFLDVVFVDSSVVEEAPDHGVVKAAVQADCGDLVEVAVVFDGVEGGFEEFDVVAVRSIDGPPDGDAGGFDADGPFPAEFGAIYWAFAGAFASTGRFVNAAVDRYDIEIESEESVIAGESFGAELVEYASGDPFIAAFTQRRV